MAKNPPGKETSKRVASAAGRLQALKGRFWIQRPFSTPGKMWSDVTRDVRAVLASALVQKLGKVKGQGRKARRKR